MKEHLKRDQYKFLQENEHLKGKIILLTLGGSHAYGTNIESSDLDIRGCALNSKSDLLGLSNFEQYIDKNTDTTIYSFKKLIKLLVNCNPNVIEMLGCRQDHYLILTEIGKELLSNRKMFLSKRAAEAFGGYATQQLRRLQNAIAKDNLPQSEKEEHILSSMKRAAKSFQDRYTAFDNGSVLLYTNESKNDGLEKEILADISLTAYPARNFESILNDLNNVIRNYEKLNNRNKKKDDQHLNKHAMHLVRLYLMCLDILEKEEIYTYREKDHELLMEIRRGAYQKEDGTYRAEFFEMISNFEEKMKYAEQNSSLPNNPNMKQIEEFVMSVNQRSLNV